MFVSWNRGSRRTLSIFHRQGGITRTFSARPPLTVPGPFDGEDGRVRDHGRVDLHGVPHPSSPPEVVTVARRWLRWRAVRRRYLGSVSFASEVVDQVETRRVEYQQRRLSYNFPTRTRPDTGRPRPAGLPEWTHSPPRGGTPPVSETSAVQSPAGDGPGTRLRGGGARPGRPSGETSGPGTVDPSFLLSRRRKSDGPRGCGHSWSSATTVTGTDLPLPTFRRPRPVGPRESAPRLLGEIVSRRRGLTFYPVEPGSPSSLPTL